MREPWICGVRRLVRGTWERESAKSCGAALQLCLCCVGTAVGTALSCGHSHAGSNARLFQSLIELGLLVSLCQNEQLTHDTHSAVLFIIMHWAVGSKQLHRLAVFNCSLPLEPLDKPNAQR